MSIMGRRMLGMRIPWEQEYNRNERKTRVTKNKTRAEGVTNLVYHKADYESGEYPHGKESSATFLGVFHCDGEG